MATKAYLDKGGLQLVVELLQTYVEDAAGVKAKFDDSSESLVVSPRTGDKTSASNILYTNSKSPSGVTTVKEALDEIYSLLIK